MMFSVPGNESDGVMKKVQRGWAGIFFCAADSLHVEPLFLQATVDGRN